MSKQPSGDGPLTVHEYVRKYIPEREDLLIIFMSAETRCNDHLKNMLTDTSNSHKRWFALRPSPFGIDFAIHDIQRSDGQFDNDSKAKPNYFLLSGHFAAK